VGILDSATISSPKRKPGEKSDWYGYYAGYSTAFVKDTLAALVGSSKEPSARILDPWNGSGTTTAIAVSQGYEAIGLDRNPALVTIAKARHLSLASVQESLEPLLAEALTVAKGLTRRVRESSDNEELGLWFNATSAARLRATERAMHRVLVDEAAPEVLSEPVDPDSLSPLASFFYCALFTSIRQLTASFRTSNPTWIRGARTDCDRLNVEWSQIEALLTKATTDLAARLVVPASKSSTPYLLFEGSVEELKLDRKADVVLSSPPYCTRIDYVVATKPELAILGNDASDIDYLRRQMLGTPLTESAVSKPDSEWGASALHFMEAVTSHRTKAASTYYRNYYFAYLRSLYESIRAIDNATKRKGKIGLVVQDSYFKEVLFNLPAIVAEMGQSLGRRSERLDFHVSRTKAAIHPGSRTYRKTFSATESLIVLREKERHANSAG
jgi:hypothetical protein